MAKMQGAGKLPALIHRRRNQQKDTETKNMKKTIHKAPATSAALPAFALMEGGPLACRDADEEAIIRAYRDIPRGEVQQFVVRYMNALATKFGAGVQPRLSLVAGSKGMRNE